ncbi:5'/3'-nucleotidase SurE [SAR202 cluster bacterium AC-647-P02_OGT_505m]|nr:5'/3'-nucleotidase SurE [SAR202 cluster bacterium AC-647-P02_OGT_505m]
MNIVLTNDDGINSPGLWEIADCLSEICNLTVVVPDRDQSGKGVSLTLLRPLSIERVQSRVKGVDNVYTVDGTPADCVIMAAGYICSEKIDLVVSGINQGANLGLDVFHSGTFGAALQAYNKGIEAIALSVLYKEGIYNRPAAEIGAKLAEVLMNTSEDRENPLLLNVNFPHAELEDIKGVDLTTLGPRGFSERVEQVVNGRREFYWIKFDRPADEDPLGGTDVWAVRNNRVSITSVNPFMSDLNQSTDVLSITESIRKSIPGQK